MKKLIQREWDGHIPERRYAVFASTFSKHPYTVVVTGKDIETAPKWGGFLRWWGEVRPTEYRDVKRMWAEIDEAARVRKVSDIRYATLRSTLRSEECPYCGCEVNK